MASTEAREPKGRKAHCCTLRGICSTVKGVGRAPRNQACSERLRALLLRRCWVLWRVCPIYSHAVQDVYIAACLRQCSPPSNAQPTSEAPLVLRGLVPEWPCKECWP